MDQEGAVGVVSAYSVPEFYNLNRLPGDFPDQIGWGGITGPGEKEAQRFAFLISSRRHQELKTLLPQGKIYGQKKMALSESEAVRSAGIFSRTAETRKSIEKLTLTLDDDEKVSRKNIEKIASLRAKELGAERRTARLSEDEQGASRMIPARVKGMELHNIGYALRKAGKDVPLKEVRAMIIQAVGRPREKEVSALRLMNMSDAPSYHVDGERSILDIRNAVAADYGMLPRPPIAPAPQGNQSRRFPPSKRSWKGIQGDISPWPQDAAASEEGRHEAKRRLEGGRRSGFPLQACGSPLRYGGSRAASCAHNKDREFRDASIFLPLFDRIGSSL